MPSINLIRLRKQIARLGIFLEVPVEFVSEYKGLLEFYHQWAHHQHAERIPDSFMLSYDLPPQVIAEIEFGLKPFLQDKPQLILPIVDALRKDMHFECSLLAAFMLGQIPFGQGQILKEYLRGWLEAPLDRAVLEAIFKKATTTLQQEDQLDYLVFLQTMSKSSNTRLANAGLIGLTLFLPSIEIDHLPKIFNTVSPLFQDPKVRQENLELLIQELAIKSPVETGYLIRQLLSDTEGSQIEVLARSFLQCLPAKTAESVAQAIKDKVT